MSSSSFPSFPFEVQKRIIHFALALTPSYPDAINAYDPVSTSWDVLAGCNGRNAIRQRYEERLGVQRAALQLMRVCKPWKREAIKYLYAEPHIDSRLLCTLASAVLRGDRKWDDLHLHPYSIPGRYIKTLNLNGSFHPHLHFTPSRTSIMRAFMDILPLVPNLTHLRLPFRCAPFRLEELCLAPFAKNLKALELVDVEYGAILDDKGRDVNVLLLRHLPNLEVLSLKGPGDANGGTGWELRKQAPLKLDKLHTLILNGVKTGIVLDTLIDSELPALRRLILTSFHQRENDLTLAFQETHGHKILSLAYLPICKPSLESHPPSETLDLHPNLIHLSYLIHDKPSHANVRLASTPFRSLPRSIRSLTLPKWNVAGTASPGIILPENQETAHFTWAPPMTNDIPSRLLNMFLNDPLPDLKVINIDGFRWVRPELGARALMTGDSGAMRVWSDKFREPGIEMRDMDGRTAPVLEFPMVEQVRGRRRPSVRAEHAVRADELDDDGG